MLAINPYVRLIRPTNWVKNLLILFPLMLSGDVQITSIINGVIGMVVFSMLASGGYILNDIKDIPRDRLHESKRKRPLASADAEVQSSFLLANALIVGAFLLNAVFSVGAFLILLTYFVLNHFYSASGKEMRFIDILLLSSFYIIRVSYGAEICGVPLTGWFMATLTLSVLALSLNKRYMECRKVTTKQVPGRGYSKDDEMLLHSLMLNFTVGSIVLLNIHAYFVLNINSHYFYFLLNLAVAGIIFFYFDYAKNNSDDPVERILKNKGLLLVLLLFLTLYTYEIIIKTR